jgi:hypothetical protein
MRIVCSGRLAMAVALLLVLAADPTFASSSRGSGDTRWLERTVRAQSCPASPINVPTSLLRASGDALAERVSIDAAGTLRIEGTADPDHIVLKRGGRPGMVRVAFNGKQLGRFGPVARILVRAGDGDDVVRVASDIDVPARIDGGAGHDCLQGGGAPNVLLGGAGEDVLIAGPGRPALHGGPGANRIVVPRRIGEIRVGPAADAGVLRGLDQFYTLRRLGSGAGKTLGRIAPPTPIILGATDLDEGRIAPLLEEAYAGGQAVVLLNATAADAARLRGLLGHPNAVEGLGDRETAAVIFVRKAPRPGTTAYDYSTGIFRHAPTQMSQSARSRSDEGTIELLSRVFSATAIVPEGPTDSPTNDLTHLADSHTLSHLDQDASGDQIQMTNSVWSVRSFQNQSDYYYILQHADYFWATGQGALFSDNTAISWPTPIQVSPTLVDTSPASTECTESTTSGVNWSIGGSAGWNFQQVANATLTGGVSVSNSTTISCPLITIVNQSDPSEGNPEWLYRIPAPSSPPQWTSFTNQWIWQVPFTSYFNGQPTITIASEARSSFVGGFPPCTPFQDCPTFGTALGLVVPLPFGDTFALQNPTVLSVNPTCAHAGTTFVINGTGFYPSLVKSVLIDGTPLDPSQYTTTSDTAITVVAPKESAKALPVVVETTQGESNSNVTIEIKSCHSG